MNKQSNVVIELFKSFNTKIDDEVLYLDYTLQSES